ncbi:MAG: glycyl-radical enzyme activating protein [Deltaproteobacteria bacterium]|nr:glycyl-radical enzyme activating protein [Deltaproteobacteria bacterium]
MRQGVIYNIQRMSTEDGPGLRTTVFLKGCPLRCLWCGNPESQLFTPQLMVFENLCTGCGLCAETCPSGAAVSRNGQTFNRDMDRCTNCGACAPECPARARVMSGSLMSVAEVMDVVRKDSLFYHNSNGGVTFGGGEPASGGEFFLDLLRAARDEGLHVCVDTCGFCPEERFKEIIPLADMFLFDCKHMDPDEHARLTGKDNALILANLRAAFGSRSEVRVRMPLIPGMNDSEANIAALAAFLKDHGRQDLDVLPCHAFGRNKYAALNLPLPPVGSYAPEELGIVLERFAGYGLRVHVV